MADFKPAFNKTLQFEGRYSNDPDDAGGKPIKGFLGGTIPTGGVGRELTV